MTAAAPSMSAMALAASQDTFALSAPFWSGLVDRFGLHPVIVPFVVCMAFLIGSHSLRGSLQQRALNAAWSASRYDR